MFDEVNGEDGSGIVHEQELNSFEEDIPTNVSVGDKVELKINGKGFWAEVTGVTGSDVDGFSLDSLETSNGVEIDLGDELQFSLSNIARCLHSG